MGKTIRGFTLIELMIVMAIIGMVATLGIGSYQISLKRARDAQRKTDLQQIRSALEIWRADFGTYPGSSNGQILGCGGACNWGGQWSSGGSVYMEKLPDDPKGIPDYVYTYDAGTGRYTLKACLENANDPQAVSDPSYTGCASQKKFEVINP